MMCEKTGPAFAKEAGFKAKADLRKKRPEEGHDDNEARKTNAQDGLHAVLSQKMAPAASFFAATGLGFNKYDPCEDTERENIGPVCAGSYGVWLATTIITGQ